MMSRSPYESLHLQFEVSVVSRYSSETKGVMSDFSGIYLFWKGRNLIAQVTYIFSLYTPVSTSSWWTTHNVTFLGKCKSYSGFYLFTFSLFKNTLVLLCIIPICPIFNTLSEHPILCQVCSVYRM